VYTIKLDATQLDDTALDRIIMAAGAELASKPHRPGFDPDARDQLRSALLGCAAYYELDVEHRLQPALRRKKRAKIVAALKSIQQQIADDRYLGQHGEVLAPLIVGASIRHPEPPEVCKLQGLSAFDVLIGRLANVFEEFFGLAAGYTLTTDQRDRRTGTSITGGEVHGRFIDFIEAALTGLKVKNAEKRYSRRAIANLGRARKAGGLIPKTTRRQRQSRG